jgi:hypothetical protein
MKRNEITLKSLLITSLPVPVGAIFFLIGGVFLAVAAIVFLHNENYKKNGIAVTGKVLSKEIENSYSGSRRSTATYRVCYRFNTREGGVLNGCDTTGRGAWHALVKDGPVTVEYLRDDPTSNRVGGEASGNVLFLMALFGGIGSLFSVIGGMALFIGLKDITTTLRLFRDGILSEATVTSLNQRNVYAINHMKMWVVKYAYSDHAGRPREGKSRLMPPDDAAQWKPGDRGQVRFDREDPGKSVWLGRE